MLKIITAFIMITLFSISLANSSSVTLAAAETNRAPSTNCIKMYDDYMGPYAYCYKEVGYSAFGGYIPYSTYSTLWQLYIYQGDIPYLGEM